MIFEEVLDRPFIKAISKELFKSIQNLLILILELRIEDIYDVLFKGILFYLRWGYVDVALRAFLWFFYFETFSTNYYVIFYLQVWPHSLIVWANLK